VHGVIAAAADGSAWSFGGSILTFAFPMILFIVVASWLYVTYTKPELAPGHRNPASERPVTYTAVPGPEPAPAGPEKANPEQANPEKANPEKASTGKANTEQAKPEGGE
jgi:hypothetical protein